MTEVYITAATRTGVGSFNGSLASLPAHDLGKIVINETITKAGVDQSEVDEVIMGQVLALSLIHI